MGVRVLSVLVEVAFLEVHCDLGKDLATIMD